MHIRCRVVGRSRCYLTNVIHYDGFLSTAYLSRARRVKCWFSRSERTRWAGAFRNANMESDFACSLQLYEQFI